METFEAIRQRRAVKHYDPNHQLTDSQVKELLDLALCSPTAFNIQNWRLVILRDKPLRQQVRKAAWDQAQITDASLVIVLCADLKSWEKQPARYWKNAAQPVQEFMLPAIDQYYRNRDQVQRDEAMRSCGIIGQTLMLAAKAMGYDSCPMDGFDYDAVGKLIHLPADHAVAFMVAIGKGIKPAWPKPGQLPPSEVVKTNTF